MPTSHHTYISDVIEIVRTNRPTSVLDIGVGFGKWGHLFREYLDVMNGRVFRTQWKTKIDGVEIFEPYIMDHQRSVYDKIYIGNVLDVVDTLPRYDLIFTSDVLEHIQKDQAIELISKLRQKSKVFVAAVPMGPKWLNSQGSMYGNDHEAHVSVWMESDFIPYVSKTTYNCNNKPIDLYVMK